MFVPTRCLVAFGHTPGLFGQTKDSSEERDDWTERVPRKGGGQLAEEWSPERSTVAPHRPAVATMSAIRSSRGIKDGWAGMTSTTCLSARQATNHAAVNSWDKGSTPTSSAHLRTSPWNWSNTAIQKGPSSPPHSWARSMAWSTRPGPAAPSSVGSPRTMSTEARLWGGPDRAASAVRSFLLYDQGPGHPTVWAQG